MEPVEVGRVYSVGDKPVGLCTAQYKEKRLIVVAGQSKVVVGGGVKKGDLLYAGADGTICAVRPEADEDGVVWSVGLAMADAAQGEEAEVIVRIVPVSGSKKENSSAKKKGGDK